MAGLIAVGALGALSASLGGSASAGTKPLCPKKTLCVWADDKGGGQLVKIKKDGISNKLAEKMNNEASSVINNRNRRSYLYDKRNGKGEKVCLSPHAEIVSLGAFADFNDMATSSKNAKKKKACPSDIM
jgi:hypothetical protein